MNYIELFILVKVETEVTENKSRFQLLLNSKKKENSIFLFPRLHLIVLTISLLSSK
jgi:hypothetical protein